MVKRPSVAIGPLVCFYHGQFLPINPYSDLCGCSRGSSGLCSGARLVGQKLLRILEEHQENRDVITGSGSFSMGHQSLGHIVPRASGLPQGLQDQPRDVPLPNHVKEAVTSQQNVIFTSVQLDRGAISFVGDVRLLVKITYCSGNSVGPIYPPTTHECNASTQILDSFLLILHRNTSTNIQDTTWSFHNSKPLYLAKFKE